MEPRSGSELRPPGRGALLLTLTATAGSADAVSYLGLQQVFTANMTGNLVLLGVAIGRGQLGGSIRSVIAFGAFGVGVLAGARLTTGTDRIGDWPRSITLALLVELSLLAAFAAGWELAGTGPVAPAIEILIALSAGAMGIQTAAARRLGVAGVTTTFVTGTLTNLLAELVNGVPNRPRVAQWAGTLACLVIGAAAGAGLFTVWRPAAPFPALLLDGIATAAAYWPALRPTPQASGDERPPS